MNVDVKAVVLHASNQKSPNVQSRDASFSLKCIFKCYVKKKLQLLFIIKSLLTPIDSKPLSLQMDCAEDSTFSSQRIASLYTPTYFFPPLLNTVLSWCTVHCPNSGPHFTLYRTYTTVAFLYREKNYVGWVVNLC